jgi:hypothetical protein
VILANGQKMFPSRHLNVKRCLRGSQKAARILLVGPRTTILKRVIRELPLERPCLILWCPHPHVALFIGRQDHRHGFGMDRSRMALGAVLVPLSSSAASIHQQARFITDELGLSIVLFCQYQ